MPSSVVVVDAYEGSLTRYEIGGDEPRKTHTCVADDSMPRPLDFSAEVVEGFRTHPPGDFYVGPPAPIPGGDRPGGTPAAARVA